MKEVTDFTGLGSFKVTYLNSAGMYVIAARRPDGRYVFLNGDGKVYDRAEEEIDHSPFWQFPENAKAFLKRWLPSQATDEAVSPTCTCDSFSLFSQGCTCGFLKRTP